CYLSMVPTSFGQANEHNGQTRVVERSRSRYKRAKQFNSTRGFPLADQVLCQTSRSQRAHFREAPFFAERCHPVKEGRHLVVAADRIENQIGADAIDDLGKCSVPLRLLRSCESYSKHDPDSPSTTARTPRTLSRTPRDRLHD